MIGLKDRASAGNGRLLTAREGQTNHQNQRERDTSDNGILRASVLIIVKNDPSRHANMKRKKKDGKQKARRNEDILRAKLLSTARIDLSRQACQSPWHTGNSPRMMFRRCALTKAAAS
jgi:hypothetical protein